MLKIVFASETGTARAVAEQISREALRHGLKAGVLDGSELSNSKQLVSELQGCCCVLFVIATSGQGQLPPSWASLWAQLLLRSQPTNLMSNAPPMAMLGLGDSAYLHFNYAGKKLRRRLLGLGAREICQPHWADASSRAGTWASLLSWLPSLWSCIPVASAEPLLPAYTEQLPEPRYTVTLGGKPASEGLRDWHSVQITSRRQLTSSGYWQNVTHVEIGKQLDYQVGDVLQVLPRISLGPVMNESAARDSVDPRVLRERKARWASRRGVRHAARVLQLPTLDTLVTISGGNDDLTSRLAFPAALEEILCCCVDLEAPVSRWAVIVMTAHASEPREKERLLELLRDDAAMEDWAGREGRTLVEAVEEFPSCLPIALHWILEMAPILQPRPFSIASSAPAFPQICVATLRWISLLGRVRTGLCSEILERDSVQNLNVRIAPGGFRADPSWADDPLLVVCCGSGAGLGHALADAKKKWGGKGQWTFVVGHRHRELDALYWNEFAGLNVHWAFSRDSPPKRVPQVLREQALLVAQVLSSSKGRVLVTGRAGPMPRDVRAAFVDALTEKIANVDETAAEKHIKALEARTRLIWEVWG